MVRCHRHPRLESFPKKTQVPCQNARSHSAKQISAYQKSPLTPQNMISNSQKSVLDGSVPSTPQFPRFCRPAVAILVLCFKQQQRQMTPQNTIIIGAQFVWDGQLSSKPAFGLPKLGFGWPAGYANWQRLSCLSTAPGTIIDTLKQNSRPQNLPLNGSIPQFRRCCSRSCPLLETALQLGIDVPKQHFRPSQLGFGWPPAFQTLVYLVLQIGSSDLCLFSETTRIEIDASKHNFNLSNVCC